MIKIKIIAIDLNFLSFRTNLLSKHPLIQLLSIKNKPHKTLKAGYESIHCFKLKSNFFWASED